MTERAPIECRANVCVETVDARTGAVLTRTWRHNLVVEAGLLLLRDLLYGDGVALTHGAVGTDSTPPAAEDTELGSEVFRDLIATKTKLGGAPQEPGLSIRFIVGSQFANGHVLREAGLFNAAVAGSLYARVIPEAVTKTDAILVIYTWSVTFRAVAL